MIIFRADATPQSGLSHLRRCAYLASLLKGANQVRLCCREDKQTARFLAEKKVPFSLVKDADAGTIDISGAKAIVFAVASFTSHDAALLEKAARNGVKTVQLVPAGSARLGADIVLTPFAEPENALLHHKFRHFNKARRKYRQKARLIFVDLGDRLPYRDLREIVDTLHRLHFKMKIVPGTSLKKADKRNLMRIYPGIHFCGKSESHARACFEADLALLPPGDEALEAACVGTPALYMPSGREQEALAAYLAGKGIGVRIPSLADFSLQTVRDAIAPLDQATREKMGAAGKALVDGLGVQRFLKILKEHGIIG